MSNEYTTHESYGMISVGRRTGGENILFGSSIPSNNKIAITICEASHERKLNRDWYSSGNTIVEVELTPVQFAEMISMAVDTTGVPCTIRAREGKRVEACEFINKRQVAEEEFENKMKDISSLVTEEVNKVSELLSQKKALTKGDKEDIIRLLNKISGEISSNIPFISQSFHNQMDRTVVEFKGEIDAFIQQKIISTGLAELKKEFALIETNEE